MRETCAGKVREGDGAAEGERWQVSVNGEESMRKESMRGTATMRMHIRTW